MSDSKFSYLYILLFCLFIFIFSLFSLQKIRCYDVWWHLAAGKWIWQHKQIPFKDIFSYTQYGRTWTDFTWGFQALVYPIYKVGGFTGIIFFKATILALAFYFLYKTLKLVGGNDLLICLLLFFVLFVSYPRFMVRPHIFSFLFVSLFLYLLTLYLRSLNTKYLLMLFFIYPFWVNLHGSFILGIFLVGAYLSGELFLRYKEQIKSAIKAPSVKALFLLFCGLVFASLFNPYGIKLFKFVILSHIGSGLEATRHIAEWKRLPLREIFMFSLHRSIFFKLIFWSSILVFIFHLHRFFRTNPINSMNSTNPINPIIFRDILIFLFFSYLTFKHARFMGIFAFALAPVIAYWSKGIFKARASKIILSGLLLFTVFFMIKQIYLNPYFKKDLGFGIARGVYPEETANFLKVRNINGSLFNTYSFGGYLIWKLYPKYPVFIDGRTPTIYPPEFYWQYRVAEGGGLQAFKKIEKQYGISIVLTRTKNLARALKNDDDWCLVGFDDRSYLFVKKKVLPESIQVFKHFDPTAEITKLVSDYKGKKQLDLLKEELEYAETAFKNTVLIYNNLGTLYAEGEGNYKQAIDCFKKALLLNSYDPSNYYNLGLAFKKQKIYHLAIENFKKALKLDKNYQKAHYHLGLIYYEKRDYEKSIKYLKRYCHLTSDYALPSAYEYLGLAYYHTLHLENAIKYFKRALLLSKNKEKEKKNYYNLGNAYFGLERYERAIQCYEEALKIDPNFGKARYNLQKAREKVRKNEN